MTTAQQNREKYLKPPTFEQIENFRNLLAVSEAAFERFYSIGKRNYCKYRLGVDLPARLWHIVYEQILPKSVEKISMANSFKKSLKKRPKKRNPTVTNSLNQLQ